MTAKWNPCAATSARADLWEAKALWRMLRPCWAAFSGRKNPVQKTAKGDNYVWCPQNSCVPRIRVPRIRVPRILWIITYGVPRILCPQNSDYLIFKQRYIKGHDNTARPGFQRVDWRLDGNIDIFDLLEYGKGRQRCLREFVNCIVCEDIDGGLHDKCSQLP